MKILQNTGQFLTGLQVNGDSYKLQQQQEMVVFRIVQEALNNAVKHSHAKNIKVVLEYAPSVFRLLITDDGIGFDPGYLKPAETGIGLKSMQSRAALIGGIFSLQAGAESGTQITIEIEQKIVE